MLTSKGSIEVLGEIGKTRVPDRAVSSSDTDGRAKALKQREKQKIKDG
jgi:hypothetical protein